MNNTLYRFSMKVKNILEKSKSFEDYINKTSELKEDIKNDYYEQSKLDILKDMQEAAIVQFESEKILGDET